MGHCPLIVFHLITVQKYIGPPQPVPAPFVLAVAARSGATSAGECDHGQRNPQGHHQLVRPTRLDGHSSAERERPEMNSSCTSFIVVASWEIHLTIISTRH